MDSTDNPWDDDFHLPSTPPGVPRKKTKPATDAKPKTRNAHRAPGAAKRRERPEKTPTNRRGKEKPVTPRVGTKTRKKEAGRPRKPKLPLTQQQAAWRRKLIYAILTLIGAIALTITCYYLYGAVKRGLEESEAGRGNQYGIGDPPPISECDGKEISVQLTDPPPTATSGEAWTTKIKLTNTSDKLCLVDASAASLTYTVTSGDVQAATTSGCNSQADPLPLLLDAQESWESTITWDGALRQDCEVGDTAPPGTYVFTVQFGAEPTGATTVITVQ